MAADRGGPRPHTGPIDISLAPVIDRRHFLGLLAGGAVAFGLVSACGDLEDTAGSTVSNNPYSQPERLTSRGGSLDVTLRAAAATLGAGSARRYGLAYNGQSPGPTLVVRPGDRLTITIENALDRETNLHTHGLHVSPSGTSDEIFTTVAPGERRTYVYEIPADHRSGMFWYHPHVHGDVAAQLAAGLVGTILVVDSVDELAGMAEANERIVVLSDPRLGTGPSVLSTSMPERMMGRQGDLILVNGIHQPRLDAGEGQLERWRLLNASPSRYYRLAIDGHQLHAVATDGGRLAAPRPVDELLLAPGERAEVLVAPTYGKHLLRALPYDRGTPMGMATGGMGMGSGASARTDAQVIATMSVLTRGASPALPTRLADLEDAGTLTPTETRQLTLEMRMGAMGGSGGMAGMGGMGTGTSMGGMGGGGGMDGAFTINGKSFDPERTDVAVDLDAVEDWTITNTSTMDHPFHLHTWPFQVVERSSGEVEAGWKDTVNVPSGSWVRIRIPFRDFGGRTVYHCHILDHEDLGMMGVIEVS